MRPGHARFEILAGAIALGEASDVENAAFLKHAAGCAACRADLERAPQTVGLVAFGRSDETWRPQLDNVVLGRIRDARAKRNSLAAGTLCWMVALSILLNVAFASGFAGRLARTAQDRSEPAFGMDAGTTLVLERRSIRPPSRARRVAPPPPPRATPDRARTLAFAQPGCDGYLFLPDIRDMEVGAGCEATELLWNGFAGEALR